MLGHWLQFHLLTKGYIVFIFKDACDVSNIIEKIWKWHLTHLNIEIWPPLFDSKLGKSFIVHVWVKLAIIPPILTPIMYCIKLCK
jgi:hypothetical protein